MFSVPSVSSIQVTRGLQKGGYRDPAGSQKVKRRVHVRLVVSAPGDVTWKSRGKRGT